MTRIIIFGATSAIAQSWARKMAPAKASFLLVGRNEDRLRVIADDLILRGAATAEIRARDLNHDEEHLNLIEEAKDLLGGFDIALIAHGTLPDQQQVITGYDATKTALDTNCLSTLSLLTILGNIFEQQQYGSLVTISSVAGDRGRQSNYVYGAGKSAVTTFMQGLRNRLFPKGVQVLTVKPGFVDTPMTAEFKKGVLWSTPDKVAEDIIKAINRKKHVIYTPSYWRLIMAVICLIPEWVFVRLKL